LKPSEQLANFGTKLQFLLLSTPPAKEKKFQENKQKHGAFWAFHGSGTPSDRTNQISLRANSFRFYLGFFNWHAIVRNGLRNMSGTELMSTGAFVIKEDAGNTKLTLILWICRSCLRKRNLHGH